LTNACTHDSVELENLVNEKDNILYADSAYRSEQIEKHLKEIKCTSKVHEKGYRNKPLTESQKKNNSDKSKIRGRIEHIFGFMTNSMNDALHLRQIGQQRIAATIGLVNLTYNLFRFEQLIRLKIV
ncbi:MAG: transposase, partial [SAR324 cluster bacterium]|nr:transposase [SAR324 cluster bacterium]